MMDENGIVKRAMEYMKTRMASSSHDYYHPLRVWKLAMKITDSEAQSGHNIDRLVVSLAAILHDTIDPKLSDPKKAEAEVEEFLRGLGLDGFRVRNTMGIMKNMSFRKMMSGHSWPGHEFKIVSDADKLDALGAIGLARVFVYAGESGHSLYDPDVPVRKEFELAEYGKGTTAINHIHEKILRLKDMMLTTEGRRMAEDRHKFVEEFVRRFMEEWEIGSV